ncbi:Mitochondrial carrier protein [Plasmodiophora brassicae]
MVNDTTAAAPAVTPFSVKLVSGAIGGFVGTAAIFPLDLVKTRLQNQTAASPVRYNGLLDGLRKTFATDGLTGAYRGLTPNLVLVLPEKALKLACNAQFRELLADAHGRVSLPCELLAGALTGIVQCSVTNPMEIIKIRCQLAGSKVSPLTVVGDLGVRGIYKGSAATLLRDVPFSIIFFTLNCKAKEWVADDNNHVSMPKTLALGTIAGVVGAVAVTPADVIKTRLQSKPVDGQRHYASIADAFKRVLREEGVKAFFKGATARGLVVGPLFGFAVLSYDICERIYHRFLK